ncbi:MAG: hypothetical protein AB7H97_20570 [Pseudobdellovibrionaceae bacterium]
MSRFLLLLIMLGTLPAAHADSESSSQRKTALYGQFGLGASDLNFKGTQSHSEFQGLIGQLEAGIDFAAGSETGVNLACLGTYGSLVNRGSTFLEQAKSTSITGKLGLFFNTLAIGGSYGFLALTNDHLSQNSVFTSEKVSTHLMGGYLSLNFMIQKKFKSTIELSYQTGELGSVKVQEVQLALRFGILQGLWSKP